MGDGRDHAMRKVGRALFTFELEPFENEGHKGVRGIVGGFGDAMVYNVKPTGPPQPKQVLHSHLVSEHLPEASVSAIGMGGLPSTYKASLDIAGTPARLSYNSYGLTKASRAMRIKYLDRAYTYTCLKSMTHDVELGRPGVHVTLTTGTYVQKLGNRRHGTVEGDADEIDLAVALVFEAVTIDPLDPLTATVYASLRRSSNNSTG